MEDGPPHAPSHTHRLPPLVRAAIVGLVAAMFLMLIGLGLIATYVYQQQQYIQGRGEQRDRENAELNERIDNAVRDGQCTLLDQLPAGGFLDRLRDTFHCGPGIPLEDLPPEIRQRFQDRGTPTPAAPATTPAPMGSAATPETTRPPEALAPQPAPEPTTPPPLVDLGPITRPVCDIAQICF